MVDHGKATDNLLDVISAQRDQIAALEKNRNEAVDWLGLANDAGWIDAQLQEHFELILLGY